MAKFSFIKSDKKGNYRISAFTVSLIIAILFWLLNSLSKNYSHKVTFNLVYQEIPFNSQPANPLPKTVNIIFEGNGFDLLWLNIKKPFKDLKVILPVSTNKNFPETFNMAVADCFTKQFHTTSQNLNISYTEPDSIHFIFTPRLVKKVPVKFNVNISYRKRFGSAKGLMPDADSVIIAGTASALAKVTQIETNNVNAHNLGSTTRLTLKLLNPDSLNIFLSLYTISAQIKVEEITESWINVNVTPPPHIGQILLIPASVKVSFNTTLDNAKIINPADFLVSAVESEKEGYAVPVIKKHPPYIKVVFINPPLLKILKEK